MYSATIGVEFKILDVVLDEARIRLQLRETGGFMETQAMPSEETARGSAATQKWGYPATASTRACS